MAFEDKTGPVLPESLRKGLEKEKENALTLYLDFVIDGTASMYSVYPAVYFAALHFLECLARYEVSACFGITVLRSEDNEEETETVTFDDGSPFTPDMTRFLKKLKNIPLYGGGEDGMESVHRAILQSLQKFPSTGRNKALMVFTDARGSDDYCEYTDYPLGQAVFFCTEELSDEDFRFCFVREDGSYDEEASPMFIRFEKLLKPMSTALLENVVKPLKDLMKGVSIGL